MAAVVIRDIPATKPLKHDPMSALKGGNAGWLHGWIRPYIASSAQDVFNGVINVYQTNYFNIADQINNQVSVIDIKNSAANASINVGSNQQAFNLKQSTLSVHG